MFNTIFTIKDGDLVLNKEAILLELAFKTILKRDRGSTGDTQGRYKSKAYNEFKYIYYVADYKSYPNEHGFTEAKRDKYAIEHCELPDSWKPDISIKLAIKVYNDHQHSIVKETTLELLRSFRGVNDVIKKVRGNIDVILNNEKLSRSDINDLLGYYQSLLNIGKDVPLMAETLNIAIKQMEKVDKLNTYDTVRGTDEVVPDSMDPDRDY